jgi:hypothetical protein
MAVKVIGLDTAKHLFQVPGADSSRRAVLRKRLKRSQVSDFFSNIAQSVVGTEATQGAHFWAWVIGSFGHQAPPEGCTHWSLRKAAVMKVNKNLIARIWKEADLKPHRLDRYMASNDPQFEQKAAAIIALYLNPPQNAAVFCVDEKSAIQGLDRLDRRLPLSPGRAEKHGFEYHRHGTTLAVRGAESADRRGLGPDRHATYQSRVCRVRRFSRPSRSSGKCMSSWTTLPLTKRTW